MTTMIATTRAEFNPNNATNCGLNKMAWVEALTLDRNVSPMARLTGICVALKYFNSDKGKAWPSQETLAKDMGATSRSVRTWLGELERAGRLEVEHGRGRGNVSSYRLALPENRKTRVEKTGRATHENRKSHVDKTGTTFPTNLKKEPKKEPVAEPQPLSCDWKPTEAERAIAMQAGLKPHEFEPVAADFKTYFLARPDRTERDWAFAFNNWVRRQIKFWARKPQLRPTDPTERDPLMAWFESTPILKDRDNPPPEVLAAHREYTKRHGDGVRMI